MWVIKILQVSNKIEIQPLDNPDNLTISKLVEILDKQFSFKYQVSGGSKLPVLAFYSIYQLIIKEIARYKDSILKPLGSHTSCDKSSKSAGDIEIFKENLLYETIEIKLDKQIDSQIIRVVKEKIDDFINIYSDLIQKDEELKIEHKIKWSELIGELNHEI